MSGFGPLGRESLRGAAAFGGARDLERLLELCLLLAGRSIWRLKQGSF
jgi:hypothetical protein